MISSGLSQISNQNLAIQAQHFVQEDRPQGSLDGTDKMKDLRVAVEDLEKAVGGLAKGKLFQAMWISQLSTTKKLLEKAKKNLSEVTVTVDRASKLLASVLPILPEPPLEVRETALKNRVQALQAVNETMTTQVEAREGLDRIRDTLCEYEEQGILTKDEESLEQATKSLNEAREFLARAQNSLKEKGQETQTATVGAQTEAVTATVGAQTEAVKALAETAQKRTDAFEALNNSLQGLTQVLQGKTFALQNFNYGLIDEYTAFLQLVPVPPPNELKG